jgi:hypothetical protein
MSSENRRRPPRSKIVATVATTKLSVSDYVKKNRTELREQLKVVQTKLALVDLLGDMTRPQKLDLLFGLIDMDRSGTIDAQELAVVLRTRNHMLTDGESIIRAVSMVKAFDEDGNAELDRGEFEQFFTGMMSNMNVDFDDLAEYLSIELSFSKDAKSQDKDCSRKRNGGTLELSFANEAITCQGNDRHGGGSRSGCGNGKAGGRRGSTRKDEENDSTVVSSGSDSSTGSGIPQSSRQPRLSSGSSRGSSRSSPGLSSSTYVSGRRGGGAPSRFSSSSSRIEPAQQ